MQHIETVTVGSGGAASITFMAVGDIPSEYTDLLIVTSLRSNRAGEVADEALVRFNGDTGSNYSVRRLYTYVVSGFVGSSADTGTSLRRSHTGANGATANTFGSGQIYIPNYRSSVAKSVSREDVTENNNTEAWLSIVAGLRSGTDPITSITIFPEVGSAFMEFSSASLYGITAGSDGIVAVS